MGVGGWYLLASLDEVSDLRPIGYSATIKPILVLSSYTRSGQVCHPRAILPFFAHMFFGRTLATGVTDDVREVDDE